MEQLAILGGKPVIDNVEIPEELFKWPIYTLEEENALLEVYRESILQELSEYSHLLYNMFKNAEIAFPQENRMILKIEDTVLNHSKSEELSDILEKIFHERCGLPVLTFFEYKEAKTGRFKNEDDIFISRRVREIASRYSRNKDGADAAEVYGQ